LKNLGQVHLNYGDFPSAAGFLERSLDLGRTWQFVDRTHTEVAASLGYTYALAGRMKESLALVASAVQAFRARQRHVAPAGFLSWVGRTYLAAGQLVEASTYAQEALACARSDARGLEAGTLFLTADIAAASGAENAEGLYREALALAEPRGMRPQVAHCHFSLGKLHRRRGDREQAGECLTSATVMYREMGMTYWLEQVEAELRQLG
jgi:tetratricopeptide (TPR) repeat protein